MATVSITDLREAWASAAVNPIFLVRVPDIKFDMYSLEIAKHFAV